jgi:hypothetical protein
MTGEVTVTLNLRRFDGVLRRLTCITWCLLLHLSLNTERNCEFMIKCIA